MFSKLLVSLAAAGFVATAAAAAPTTTQTTTTKTMTPMAHSTVKTRTTIRTAPGKRYAYGHERSCRTVTHHGKKSRVCSARHVTERVAMHRKTTVTTKRG